MPDRRPSPKHAPPPRRRRDDRARAPAKGPPQPAEATTRLGLGVRLVYEDDELIVVDKPPGLVTAVLPGEGEQAPKDLPSVFGEVKKYVRNKRRAAVRVWIIHRLDKEATGLLVFAKTERAFAWLKEDFRSRRAHRLYMAVVEGQFPPDALSGTLQAFLAEDDRGLMRGVPGRRTISGPDADRAGPQLAVTHYRVIAQGNNRALTQIRLQTGRKNQIRVQMSEAGHPLVGDYRYRGTLIHSPVDNPINRMCLHAVELGFSHPSRGETMRFSSPAPASFWTLVGATPPATLPISRINVGPADAHGTSSDDSESTTSNPSTDSAPRTVEASSRTPRPPEPNPANPDDVSTSWDHVAKWYEDLLDRGRSDHQRDVIVPGALRLLRPTRGMRVLDIACGEGMLCRRLAALGVEAVGVDASPRLIEAARATALAPGSTPARFEVGDARTITSLALGDFDAAACVMALMNIDSIEPVLRGIAKSLRPGGAFVSIILHPAFRAPGQTSWGWDEPAPTRARAKRPTDRRSRDTREPARSNARQYRRVDGYLSPGQMPIVMNPGQAARGKEPVTTWTFHRPLQHYVKAFSEAGLLLESIEEWPSIRRSQPGPRAAEENRARREIPLFLGMRAVKR